jgi:hypothetical protein
MLIHQFREDVKPFYDTQTADSYLITDFIIRPGKESVVDQEICISY